jgi:hypothetical protein
VSTIVAVRAGEYFVSPGEIQTAISKREIAFGRIEGNPQINVPTINVKKNVA